MKPWTYKSVEAASVAPRELYSYMLGCIGPRPIALVSTCSKEGFDNLAPFSFFNGFGTNPPIVAFGPAKRAREGTQKDTYTNITETRECVIQAVPYAIVEQVNVASSDCASDIDEFVLSGLTPIPSDRVKPNRVAESPFQMECSLEKVLQFGDDSTTTNLVVCRVLTMHVAEEIMGDGQTIDPHKLDLVGRLGGGWYVRASGEALFEVPRPIGKRPIGLQGLPGFIRDSHLYSGNDLGRFGLRESIPTESEVSAFFESHATEMPFSEVQFNQAEKEANLTDMFAQAMDMVNRKHPDRVHYLERTAKAALALGEIEFAWHAAMLAGRQQRAQVG